MKEASMRKILLFSILVLLLAACTSTKETNTAKLNRENQEYWWLAIEERGNEHWYVNEDEGEFHAD